MERRNFSLKFRGEIVCVRERESERERGGQIRNNVRETETEGHRDEELRRVRG